MDAIELYLARIQVVRDAIKFLIGLETPPIQLENKLLELQRMLNREIERTKRAAKILSEATPLPPESVSGGSDFPVTESDLVDAMHPESPPIDETVQKKKTAKS